MADLKDEDNLPDQGPGRRGRATKVGIETQQKGTGDGSGGKVSHVDYSRTLC